MKQLVTGLVLLFSLALFACAPAVTEPPAETEAPPAEPADAVAVDPGHYQVEFENDRVRVLRISYGPGEKSVMHNHPDSVAVTLAGGNMRFTFADGTTADPPAEVGQPLWDAATQHLPENLGDQPFEAILVELKDGATAEAGETGPDPVEVDPAHYQVAFENDRVRVLNINYGPEEKSVMHYHPAAVVIALSDQSGRFNFPDGTAEDWEMAAGQVRWADATQHLPESLPGQSTQVVLVELK